MATTKSETHAPKILLRPHDGVVAQPISKIIITSDMWLHTFEISLPERPTQQQIDKVATNVPHNRDRFAPISFFHSLVQEVISLSTDPQCQSNASAFQHTGTLIDCAPAYSYVNAVKYIWKFKNLKYVQEIHQLVNDFIPQISRSEARKKKRSFWHFFGAATTEDDQILQDNIMNLQTATEISLRSFANIAEKYSSFMNLPNEHFQNLGAALTKQTANTHKNLRNINAAITFLFSLILGHSDYADTAFLLHHLEHQLQELLAGRLPRDLITPQMLADVRGNITRFLKQLM
jgi:hypothetical protein